MKPRGVDQDSPPPIAESPPAGQSIGRSFSVAGPGETPMMLGTSGEIQGAPGRVND